MTRHRGESAGRPSAGTRLILVAVALLAVALPTVLVAQAPPVPSSADARAAVLALADARRWDGEQLPRLAAHADPAVRAATAATLGHLANPDGIALLGRLAGDREPGVRAAAAAAAGRLAADLGGGGTPLATTLEKLLGDGDAAVRRAAAWAFARSGLAGWDGALQRRLAAESDRSVRAACLQELWRAEGSAWLEAASAALADGDAGIRLAAAWSLARRGGDQAAAALARVARDSDPAVRVVVLGGASRHPCRAPLAITPRLQREQAGIGAALLHQLLVAALLDDAPAVQHDDVIGHPHRRETVGDQDGDPVARQPPEVLEDLGLGPRIHRRGRFVEHQHVRLAAHEGA